MRDQLGASAKPARLEGLSLRHYCTITTSSVEPRLETRGVPKVSSLLFSVEAGTLQLPEDLLHILVAREDRSRRLNR